MAVPKFEPEPIHFFKGQRMNQNLNQMSHTILYNETVDRNLELYSSIMDSTSSQIYRALYERLAWDELPTGQNCGKWLDQHFYQKNHAPPPTPNNKYGINKCVLLRIKGMKDLLKVVVAVSMTNKRIKKKKRSQCYWYIFYNNSEIKFRQVRKGFLSWKKVNKPGVDFITVQIHHANLCTE